MNNTRQVAGYSYGFSAVHPAGYSLQATSWQGGVLASLGVLPGALSSDAYGINDSGQIVGTSGGRAFSFDSTLGMSALGNLYADDTTAVAFSVNSGGLIVGVSARIVGPPLDEAASHQTAVYWIAGVAYALPSPLEYRFSFARDVNDLGVIVGSVRSTLIGGVPRDMAVAWANGIAVQLDDLAGGVSESGAYAVNEAGTVVGFGTTDSGYRATSWQGGAITDLGARAGANQSVAYDINDDGSIVGYSTFSYLRGPFRNRATLWDPLLGVFDLNDQVGDLGWTLAYAQGINDGGDIIALGYQLRDDGLIESRSFLLVPTGEAWKPQSTPPPDPEPVPEPTTLTLIAAAVLGATAARRRKPTTATC